MSDIRVTALYKFVRFDDPETLRTPLFERLSALGIKGTLLLATEGINGTIAGPRAAMDEALDAICALPGCADLEWKDSHAEAMPFLRLKVRLKNEIVTMGVPGTDPTCLVGSYVKPQDWNALITDPDTVLIDTRNDYEVALGTFQGAIDPETETFREFPDWFETFRAKLAEQGRSPKIAMFCTGGIRCEKSTSYVKSLGIEDVFHLQGGILKYLETVPREDSLWQGECFVFDDRVSVGHGLEVGDFQLCHACRHPVSVPCRLREVVLRDKPAEMLEASPKGTVPVIVEADGRVIEESLDVMAWALAQNAAEDWLSAELGSRADMDALIAECDGPFKRALDRYKYPNRYEDEGVAREDQRALGLAFLQSLNARLADHPQLFGTRVSFADIAIFPFIRKFANTDRTWFDALDLPHLQAWLAGHLDSARFKQIMPKFAQWKTGDEEPIFPERAIAD